jgi:hypothetical protein
LGETALTRRAEQIPLDDDWVLTKVWSKSRAAPAILAAIQSVPRDEAFIPALSAGPAFDSPEPRYDSPEQALLAAAVIHKHADSLAALAAFPPPCDGNAQFGHEGAQAGQVLAHAQHEAAEGGPECTATACLMARGAND